MQTIVKDSRKKARQLDISGHIKPSGMIVSHLINDKNVHYYPTISPNGITTCRFYNEATGERGECLGHKHAGHCYHVTAVREQASTFPTYEQLVVPQYDPEPLPPAAIVETPDEDRTPVISIEEIVEWAEGQLGINPFEEVGDPRLEPPMTECIVRFSLSIPVLASTKGNSCFYCGHLCKGDVCRGCSV